MCPDCRPQELEDRADPQQLAASGQQVWHTVTRVRLLPCHSSRVTLASRRPFSICKMGCTCWGVSTY